MAVIAAYQCQCRVPTPKELNGEDWGLCAACNLVYDERLYEMRCRQHIPKWEFDSVHEYLMTFDDNYRMLVLSGASTAGD